MNQITTDCRKIQVYIFPPVSASSIEPPSMHHFDAVTKLTICRYTPFIGYVCGEEFIKTWLAAGKDFIFYNDWRQETMD